MTTSPVSLFSLRVITRSFKRSALAALLVVATFAASALAQNSPHTSLLPARGVTSTKIVWKLKAERTASAGTCVTLSRRYPDTSSDALTTCPLAHGPLARVIGEYDVECGSGGSLFLYGRLRPGLTRLSPRENGQRIDARLFRAGDRRLGARLFFLLIVPRYQHASILRGYGPRGHQDGRAVRFSSVQTFCGRHKRSGASAFGPLAL